MVSRVLRLVAGVPLVAIGTACYEYHTTSISSVHPAETVHVELSPAGSASLTPTIGPNATMLDGQVLSVNQKTFKLAVTQVARAAGPEEFMRNEPIEIPVSGLSTITVRSFDRTRSILIAGALLAGVFAAHIVTNQPSIVSTRGGPAAGTR
jgi:hypothetical protein